jgi:hypothetical protein
MVRLLEPGEWVRAMCLLMAACRPGPSTVFLSLPFLPHAVWSIAQSSSVSSSARCFIGLFFSPLCFFHMLFLTLFVFLSYTCCFSPSFLCSYIMFFLFSHDMLFPNPSSSVSYTYCSNLSLRLSLTRAVNSASGGMEPYWGLAETWSRQLHFRISISSGFDRISHS